MFNTPVSKILSKSKYFVTAIAHTRALEKQKKKYLIDNQVVRVLD